MFAFVSAPDDGEAIVVVVVAGTDTETDFGAPLSAD